MTDLAIGPSAAGDRQKPNAVGRNTMMSQVPRDPAEFTGCLPPFAALLFWGSTPTT